MHFVSEFAGKKLVRARKERFSVASGEKIGVDGTIWLTLERGTAPDWAAEEAAKHFRFAMRPTPGSIGGADIPVSQWCVYIDTVAWQQQHNHSEDIRQSVEALLSNSPDVMEVFPPVLRAPWPKYDELVKQGRRTDENIAEQNLLTAEQIGVSVADLISYEEARFGREGVLAAYQAALEAEDVPVIVALGVDA